MLLYYSVRCFHLIWGGLPFTLSILMFYPDIFEEYKKYNKYKKYLLIPSLSISLSYIVFNRKCCLLVLEDYLLNETLKEDEHYIVMNSTLALST